MVEPFSRRTSWSDLLPQAQHACMQVFRQLPKLEHVEVGICERVDHPYPTITNAFIKRWGRDVITHENPAYVEDTVLNLAWASGVIAQTIPGNVKSLHLSAANLDGLRRLMYDHGRPSISYNPARKLLSVTNLTLDIRGVQDCHARIDWQATESGTYGMVEYWVDTINSLPKLVHLQLNGKFGDTTAGYEDLIDCTHNLLLPSVKRPLQSLSLRNFDVSIDTLLSYLPTFKSSLKSLVLDRIVMLECVHEEEAPWLTLATWVKDHMQGTRIRVDHPYNYKVPVSKSSLNKMSAMGMQVTG